MAAIVLDRLRKVFSGGHVALDDLSLDIADGERLAIVGPSGSGKSTALRAIAGLETPTAGRVLIDGQDVTDVPPERRDLAMVFQSYALYPHKTVRENLAFGLRVRGVSRLEVDARVRAIAASLGIAALLDRRPAALSGGQRQRVALGRAIIRDPRAFLFDEPLSNLDPRLRGDTRAELVALHARLGATMVYVTHDQEEAMTLGQRIAVLRDGRLAQVASPGELYDRPADVGVAQFIGSPPMNLLVGAAAAAVAGARAEAVVREGLTVGVRPHDVDVTAPAAGEGRLEAEVVLVEPLGHAVVVHAALADGARLVAVTSRDARLAPTTRVALHVRGDRLHYFTAAGARREL